MENKTAIQIAIEQIGADIETCKTAREDGGRSVADKESFLSAQLALENFKLELEQLLPFEQQRAQQESIGFGKWLLLYQWEFDEEEKLWDSNIMDGGVTDEQLFQIYSQQKGK